MQVAAHSADLVIRFVNTQAAGNGQPELLGDARAFADWLRREKLGGEDTVVTDADAAEARELREALAVLLLRHVGVETAPEVVAAAERHLRRSAAMHPVNLLVTADGCDVTSPQTGVAAAIGTLLAAVFRAESGGLWARLKMCHNPPCHTGFVDNTRNSGGLYCSSTCRSQMSMRAYRDRQRGDLEQAHRPSRSDGHDQASGWISPGRLFPHGDSGRQVGDAACRQRADA
ncbi:zf-CGNR multi-domain protein [Pseudonocardiaceae bacterium YIM PH 21723]|nr:zf-CGNR multi-domain protein [Pseudonocardiaceae bacterium YIM PH 21723]